MSGKGFVTTSRGEALNMDDLVQASKKPIGFKDQKAELASKPQIKKPLPINVRGYVPDQGTAVPLAPVATPPLRAQNASEALIMRAKGQTPADLTGVTVDRATWMAVKEGETVNPGDGIAYAQNEVLTDIFGQLKQVPEQPEERPNRSRRRKTETDISEDELE